MTDDRVLLDREEPVGWITFNRPDQHNAFTNTMLREIIAFLRRLDDDPSVRVIILRANGPSFSSGADLTELVASSPLDVRRSNREWIDLFHTIEIISTPVIAQVGGNAIAGGTELTLSCDLVVAAEDARFGLTEMRVGVIPGAGACVRLPRWVGRASAKEILMTGDPISAQEARRIGLVNRVVPASELAHATLELAMRIASRSPAALAAVKRAVNVGAELPLDAGIEYVLQEFALLFAGPEQAEGMRAFLERRTPNYGALST